MHVLQPTDSIRNYYSWYTLSLWVCHTNVYDDTQFWQDYYIFRGGVIPQFRDWNLSSLVLLWSAWVNTYVFTREGYQSTCTTPNLKGQVLQKAEHDLQTAVYKLTQIANKTKIIAFGGKFPIWTKIVTGNKLIQLVSHFNYSGYIQY